MSKDDIKKIIDYKNGIYSVHWSGNSQRRKICNGNDCKNLIPLKNKSEFCLSCYSKDQASLNLDRTIEEIEKKVIGKHRSWMPVEIRNFGRSWNKELLKIPCQKCGYSLHTELCHIKSISSFDKKEKLRNVNHPSNLLSLCPNCHWEFDNKKFAISSILPHNIMNFSFEDEKNLINLERMSGLIVTGEFFETSKRFSAKRERSNSINPGKQILESLVFEKPTQQIAKEYGVSDKAVEKWCKKFGIEKPRRGYWSKKRAKG